MPITDDSLIAGTNDVNAALRMQLHLGASCPSSKTPLAGVGWPLVSGPTSGTSREETCRIPAPADPVPRPDCPVLTVADRAELDQLCEDPDFNDRQARPRIEAILRRGAEPACLYLCRLGDVKRGTPAADLRGFEVRYDDTISALFVSQLVDGRAVRLGHCARGWGRLTGRFRFTIVRSRAAQPFP